MSNLHVRNSSMAARVLLACVFAPAVAVAAEVETDAEKPSVVLFPHREAVLSAEVSARIANIRKRFGESFQEGEVLIELDRDLYETRLKRAQVEVVTARDEVEAMEKLYEGRSASRIQLVHAKKTLALAQVDLRMAERELENCTIRAPYAGKVVAVRMHEHEFTTRGEEILSIVDDSKLRAQFLLSARLLGQVRIGQAVTIRLRDLPATPVTGVVAHISATVDPASASFEVHAQIDNRQQRLRSGLIGTLESIRLEE